MLLAAALLLFAAAVLSHVSGLSFGFNENDYSAEQVDGHIDIAILGTDTVSRNVTLSLRITPMTYVQYNAKFSAPLTLRMGCYPADSSHFNNTPLVVNISISKGKGLPVPIALKVGIVDRNESERTECFIIVLDILLISGQENISLARNVSIMYIFNSHPFTVSFENQKVSVNEDVGIVEVYLVKDNNQKVGYNFTVMLNDYTPPPPGHARAGIDYIVEQMAVPFPADKQRVPVVIRIANVSVSKEDETLQLGIAPSPGNYTFGQQYILDVTITNNNYVTVELENATYWLTVCLSVVDPVLLRIISLDIQAWNLTDQVQGLDPFNTWTIYLSPTVTMECINVTENDDYLSTFLVTVSSPTSRVLVIPDRYIGENTVFMAPTNSQVPPVGYSTLNNAGHTTMAPKTSMTASLPNTAIVTFIDSTMLPNATTTVAGNNSATILLTSSDAIRSTKQFTMTTMQPSSETFMLAAETSGKAAEATSSTVTRTKFNVVTSAVSGVPVATSHSQDITPQSSEPSLIITYTVEPTPTKSLTGATKLLTRTAVTVPAETAISIIVTSTVLGVSIAMPYSLDITLQSSEPILHTTGNPGSTLPETLTDSNIASTRLSTMVTISSPSLLMGSTLIMSNLTSTSEPASTISPFIFSWWVVLIITVACGLLCCCWCAVVACLYICLCRRAWEKAYFPASIEEHDERYNKWRCGVIDEVKLEEYKISCVYTQS